MDGLTRCPWALSDPVHLEYHDREWGAPSHDDAHLFEMLILEGVQAGLSWATVLRKRAGYREAYDGFDPVRIAAWGPDKLAALREDGRIIRNRLKIEAAVKNARAFLDVQAAFGGFHQYVWRFVDGRPIVNRWEKQTDVPVTTPESDALSKDLKKRGFAFVGTTSIYAYMQSVGMVNDHLMSCFRWRELA